MAKTKRYVLVDVEDDDPRDIDFDTDSGPIFIEGSLPPAIGNESNSLLAPYLQGVGESVTWRHLVSTDQYGDPTFQDTNINVIWFDQQRIRRGPDKIEVLCDAYCLVDPAYVLVMGDSIQRAGMTWPVINIGTSPGFNGIQFLDVSLKRA